MSKMSNSGLRRLAGAAAIAAAAAVGMASMGAGAAGAGPLPNGSKTTIGVDGTSVKITRSGESAYPVPSVANNGAGRAAEVNGNVFVNVKSAGDVKGSFETGYLVGCQIDITGLSGGLSGSVDFLSPTAGLSGALSIPLTPGQIGKIALGSRDIKKGVSAIQYKRQGIDVQRCGGYAQARAYTTVSIKGDYYIKSTLYGAPFSIN